MSSIAQLMKPVGPKAEAFAWDKRIITGIMGPVGSAKTTTCIRKMIHGARWQKPGPDGIKRAKWAVVRDTYGQLRKTVLQSWWSWFPKEVGKWNGEAPFEHTIAIKVPGEAPIQLTVVFAAIGDAKVEDVMRGWEITGLWLNEADLLSQKVLSYGMGRIGRYPGASLGGCTWRGIIIDMNAPDVENWTYSLLVDQDLGLEPEVEETLRAELGELFGVGFYRQPGGRSKDPPPENIANLPKGYYAQQQIGQTKDYIRRMVDNEFGATRNGKPVYTEFVDDIHVAKVKLKPLPGVPLTIGVDGGNTPAAVIGQRDSFGRVRILAELVVFVDSEESDLQQVTARRFGEMVRDFCADHYPDNEIGNVWADPATAAGEKAEGTGAEEKSWRQAFAAALGVRVRRCKVPGNAITPRIEAVESLMTQYAQGEPKFQISLDCKYLRRGFNNGYIWQRTKLAGGHGRWSETPLKNDYSHSQDALQYLCFGIGDSRHGGMGHNSRGRRRVIRNDRAYDVHAGVA